MTTRFVVGTLALCAALAGCDSGTDPMMGTDAGGGADGGVALEDGAVDSDGATPETDGGGMGTDASMPMPCMESATRCGGAGVEQCTGGDWVEVEACPIGCVDGACSDEIMCTPGERRCAGDVGEICNSSGSAFLYGEGCGAATECVDGLCTGACAPGALRCNGLTAEACAADGSGYEVAEACTTACVRGRCALERLDVTSDMDLDGEIIVAGPVNVFPGITLRSPSGNLTIRAERITIDEGASIIASPTGDSPAGRGGAGDRCYGGGITSEGGGAGGGYGTAGTRGAIRGYTCGGGGGRVWGSDTDVVVEAGSPGGDAAFGSPAGGRGGGVVRLYAAEITVSGSVRADGQAGSGTYTSASGGGSGGGVLLAGDRIAVAGTVSAAGGGAGSGAGGLGRVKILYGSMLDLTGTVTGQTSQSLLPPLEIGSVTHPDPELFYNDGFDHAVFSWNAPFAGRQGYFWLFDATASHVPPASAPFVDAEAVAVPFDTFAEGDNWLHLVPVDAASNIGTVESAFRVRINTTPPPLSSSSHPSPTEWTANPNVLFEWTMPHGDASYRGVHYVLDHRGDTVPTAADTFLPVSQLQILRTGLEDGVWVFHVVSVDTRGRLTRNAAHYQVRLGADPGVGEVLGSVSGPGGPVAGATISINGGLFPEQMTNSTGEFHLSGIPAGTWELTASADGLAPTTQMITVTADGTVTVPVTLTM
ncbi:MAG: carboxypeptidase-like regulatory domain-containing protein [Sandaracinaceae bacterium]